jgi:hypothetical protein
LADIVPRDASGEIKNVENDNRAKGMDASGRM